MFWVMLKEKFQEQPHLENMIFNIIGLYAE